MTEEEARLALNATALAIGGLDMEGRWTWANPACLRLLGYDEPADLIGRRFPVVDGPRRDREPSTTAAGCPFRESIHRGEAGHVVDLEVGRADGGVFPAECWADPLRRAGSVIGAVVVLLDRTARREAEARLQHLAYFDALTGLPNRVLFGDRLEQALHRSRRERRFVALHVLDLDRFKGVNDAFGHGVGDALLKAVAARLRGSVRATDTVARLGGDEFAVLQADLPDPTGATILAGRLVGLLAEPFLIDQRPIRTSASVGVHVASGDDPGAVDMLPKADRALYRAKAAGRNTFRVFRPDAEG